MDQVFLFLFLAINGPSLSLSLSIAKKNIAIAIAIVDVDVPALLEDSTGPKKMQTNGRLSMSTQSKRKVCKNHSFYW
jgi:hypothetical protein